MTAASSSVIARSAFAARVTTYAAPARRRARSGGSASRRATILRTVAVSASGVGAAAAAGRGRGGWRGGAVPPKRLCRKDMVGAPLAVGGWIRRSVAQRSGRGAAGRRAGRPGRERPRRVARGSARRAGVRRPEARGRAAPRRGSDGRRPARRRGAAARAPGAASTSSRQEGRADGRGQALGKRPPVERVGDRRGRQGDQPLGPDEARQHVVEDPLDQLAERVVRRPDAVLPEGDVGHAAGRRGRTCRPSRGRAARCRSGRRRRRPAGSRRSCRSTPRSVTRTSAFGASSSSCRTWQTSTHSWASPVADSLIPSGLSRTTSRANSTERPARWIVWAKA